MYSPEEIEQKRKQALQRKTQKILFHETSAGNSTNLNNVMHNSSNSKSTLGTSISKNVTINYKDSYRNKFSSPKSSQSKTKSFIKQQSLVNRFNPISSTNQFYGNQQTCEITCFMISNERFVVDTSLFHSQLIDMFKTIPSKCYDPKNKMWNFHINDYELLNEKIISMKSDVSFKGLPNFILKTFKNLIKQEKEPKKNIDLSQIDSTLINSLYPFQKEGIEYGISKNGKCFIADDMGLGKTRQALGIAHYYKKDWPLIIVTPSSVRYQWSEAICESIPSVPVQSVQHVVTTKDFLEKSQITILSYDLLVRRIDEIVARRFGVLICDESHYLKSSKTQRSKAVQRLAMNIAHVILLTGTPALSRPIELYPQIKLLIPSFMSYQEFGLRYCDGVQTNFGWDFSGSSNLKELDILLKACCLIRRLKSDVMAQLPSKIRQKIILDPHLIKASTKEMKNASKNMQMNHAQKDSVLLQYYSESSKAKEKAVCDYITDLIESQEKFLVFAHHQNMMDALCNLLTSKKIMFIRIDGKTNPEQRKHFVDTFQENDNVMVAVLSITAANAGITMTSARLVIFAELAWNPGILCQAEDRVHRIGQTDNVVIRYLLAKDTADEYLWPRIQKKIDVLNEVGLDQNLDLDKADVTNQALSNQQSLDQFIETKSNTSMHVDGSSGNTDLHASSDSLKDLLDIDDDAFDEIDLDNIV